MVTAAHHLGLHAQPSRKTVPYPTIKLSMLRNNLFGIDETGKVAQWAWFPLKAFSASFSLDVSGMLKYMQCMETGYVSTILRLGRIPSVNNPMLLPAKPVKSMAVAQMFTLQQNLSFTRSEKNS